MKLYMFRVLPLPIIRSTLGNGMCHTRLKTAFERDQDGTCFTSSILVLALLSSTSILDVLESCHQAYMTYTSAECTMENS
jgi:hypothetical protein